MKEALAVRIYLFALKKCGLIDAINHSVGWNLQLRPVKER
jgi:hypothetical protein